MNIHEDDDNDVFVGGEESRTNWDWSSAPTAASTHRQSSVIYDINTYEFIVWYSLLLLRPRERLRSAVMSTSVCVCVSVCLSVREDISGTTRVIFTKICACCQWLWLGLLRRRCDTLCTSAFMDDIMFLFYNWPYSSMIFASNDLFCLKLRIYRKVSRNLISYY